MKLKNFLFIYVSTVTLGFVSYNANSQDIGVINKDQAIKVRKIWDNAPYNAFTDLIRFKGNFYCTFREGTGHIPGKHGSNGQIRILKSKTGNTWHSIALLKKDNMDLRDPKLSITPDRRLMVICGGSVYKGDSLLARYPHVSFSNADGSNFSTPERVTLGTKIESDYAWVWRVTWYKNMGYGIDYQIGPNERRGPTKLFLVSTPNGKTYSLVHEFHIDGFPNESTIRFDKYGNMYVLIRRELGDQKGELAISRPPYKDWTFHKLTIRLGGPNFIFWGQHHLIIGSRSFEKVHDKSEVHTSVFLTDLNGKIDTTIQLKSGNDTGYPSLVIYNHTLWVTYYSNHDDKHHTSIYLAQIPMSLLKK